MSQTKSTVRLGSTMSFSSFGICLPSNSIIAFVVAVGCAHDDMDMVFIGLGVFAERNAALMVELDDDHRTLDAVVKCAVVRHAAHPAEISVFEVQLHFFHLQLGMTAAHAADMVVDQIEQQVVLRVG